MIHVGRERPALTTALALTVTILGAQICHAAAPYTRSEVPYRMPDVVLYNQDGQKVRLVEYLKHDKPIIVDFIYATCTTICPVLSAGFANFQKKSGVAPGDIRLVSFSIDPENDTPEVMKAYLARYGAKPGWDFLTGTREDIDKVMRAFDAYVPDKMSHLPISFYKGPRRDAWVRIYGLIGTSEMKQEYQESLQPKP
jgi:protein SCO1/2